MKILKLTLGWLLIGLLTSINCWGSQQIVDDKGVIFTDNGRTLYRYNIDLMDESYTIPEGVTTIADVAFSYAVFLKSVKLPASLTKIGDFAFANCCSLTTITLPAELHSIGEGAFISCEDLTTIAIPAKVEHIGARAFSSIKKLKISLAQENKNFVLADEVLFNQDSSKLLFYSNSRKSSSYAVPDGVEIIGEWAFYDCRNLKSITIPASVKRIGGYAFVCCTALNSVKLAEGLTAIGDAAFADCTALTKISLPSSVVTIGEEIVVGTEAVIVQQSSPHERR